VAFAVGVGQVMLHGEHRSIPTAHGLLRKFAARPPFKGEPRMRSLFGTLGMQKEMS
jgi:hypothetical protein